MGIKRWTWRWSAVALVCVSIVAFVGAVLASGYELLDLGPGAAFETNAAGRFAGSIRVNGVTRAAFWESATAAPTDLAPAGATFSRIFGINARGEMVGLVTIDGVSRGMYWSSASDAPVDLGPGTNAVAINDAGQFIGLADFGNGIRAAFWSDIRNPPIDLLPAGATSASPSNLNNAGQIVGSARFNAVSMPVMWPTPGTEVIVLGDAGRATGINERGEIVGQIGTQAVYWPAADQPVATLQALASGQSSQAIAISGPGRIVGTAKDAGGIDRPVLWPSAIEPPVDLLGNEPGSALAQDINARGDIVGHLGTSAAGSAAVWKRTAGGR